MPALRPDVVSGRFAVYAAWFLTMVVAVVVTWWAASRVLTSAEGPADDALNGPTYTAEYGEVGVTSTAQAEVSFTAGPPGVAGAGGTVTSLDVAAGEPFEAGDVVFSVDQRPVVAVEGSVPAFRDLEKGTSGDDVRQLRAFLGLDDGEQFDAETETAVRAWEEDLGVASDGVVAHGDIVFVESLPTRGYIAEGVVVGSVVTPGQQIIATVQERPVVSVPADNGGLQFTPGMTARINVGDAVVTGVLGVPYTRDDGLLALAIVDTDGESVCDAICAKEFPVTGSSTVAVEVAITPATEGVVVPGSALAVVPDGDVVVRTPAGEKIPVEVVTQGDGMAVVNGVEPGVVIELFGEGTS